MSQIPTDEDCFIEENQDCNLISRQIQVLTEIQPARALPWRSCCLPSPQHVAVTVQAIDYSWPATTLAVPDVRTLSNRDSWVSSCPQDLQLQLVTQVWSLVSSTSILASLKNRNLFWVFFWDLLINQFPLSCEDKKWLLPAALRVSPRRTENKKWLWAQLLLLKKSAWMSPVVAAWSDEDCGFLTLKDD